METKDYTQEIIDIIRSNTSPAVMSSRLEDYHANDLAEVLKKLTVQERCKLYRILDKDMLSDILEYTEADEAAELLPAAKTLPESFFFSVLHCLQSFFPCCVIPSVVFPYYFNRYKYLVSLSSPVSIL